MVHAFVSHFFSSRTHSPADSLSRADACAKDNWKCTPLHRACHNGDADMVELLVNRGASLSARDDEKERPGQSFGEHVSSENQQV